MTEPLVGLPDDARAQLVAAPAPARPEAMAATLTDARFSDPDWMFERKLDGELRHPPVPGAAARQGRGRRRPGATVVTRGRVAFPGRRTCGA